MCMLYQELESEEEKQHSKVFKKNISNTSGLKVMEVGRGQKKSVIFHSDQLFRQVKLIL